MSDDTQVEIKKLTKEEEAVAQLIKDEKFNVEYHTKKLNEAKLRLEIIKAGVNATKKKK